MSDTGVSVGRWPGARDDYRITVTATRRRDRGRKMLELRTFERNPAKGAWSVDPGDQLHRPWIPWRSLAPAFAACILK